MDKDFIHNTKLGIFVVSGIILLITALYFIGNNKNMFGKTFTLYATFQNVNGLQTGNNVRYAGIDVGTVQKIEFKNDTAIKVEMSIMIELKNTIRKNSIASVGTDGLMGNKLINIEPGNSSAAFVNEGDELLSIPAVNTEEMLRTLEITNLNVAVISANLKELTENINSSRGTLYTVLRDTTLAKALQHTLGNIEAVSNDLSDITDDFSTIVQDIRYGKGLLGTLAYDTTISYDFKNALSQVLKGSEQIKSSATELNNVLQKISNGNGTVGVLLNDSITAVHLKNSMANIDSSSAKFNENMEAMKHNFLTKGYFKQKDKEEKSKKKNNNQ